MRNYSLGRYVELEGFAKRIVAFKALPGFDKNCRRDVACYLVSILKFS